MNTSRAERMSASSSVLGTPSRRGVALCPDTSPKIRGDQGVVSQRWVPWPRYTLLTLWDIMNRFDAERFFWIGHSLERSALRADSPTVESRDALLSDDGISAYLVQ